MEKKEDFLENFKTAITSTIKSISGKEDIDVIFGSQNSKSNKKTVKLPELEGTNRLINYARIRAFADSESLKIKYIN
jgi:cobalamin biosynthesis protein CobT